MIVLRKRTCHSLRGISTIWHLRFKIKTKNLKSHHIKSKEKTRCSKSLKSFKKLKPSMELPCKATKKRNNCQSRKVKKLRWKLAIQTWFVTKLKNLIQLIGKLLILIFLMHFNPKLISQDLTSVMPWQKLMKPNWQSKTYWKKTRKLQGRRNRKRKSSKVILRLMDLYKLHLNKRNNPNYRLQLVRTLLFLHNK